MCWIYTPPWSVNSPMRTCTSSRGASCTNPAMKVHSLWQAFMLSRDKDALMAAFSDQQINATLKKLKRDGARQLKVMLILQSVVLCSFTVALLLARAHIRTSTEELVRIGSHIRRRLSAVSLQRKACL